MKRILFYAVIVAVSAQPSARAAAPIYSGPIDYETPTTSGLSIDVADIDGDGDLDIGYGSTGNSEAGWLENTDPATQAMVSHHIGSQLSYNGLTVLGDVTGDGLPDLIATKWTTGAGVYHRLSDVRQPWAYDPIHPLLINYRIELGNFTPDAKKEMLLVRNYDSYSGLEVYEVSAASPSGRTIFGDFRAFNTNSEIASATATDWNNDGLSDILLVEFDSTYNCCGGRPSLTLYRNNGDETFKTFFLSGLPATAQRILFVKSGDWTGDGYPEAVLADKDRVYLATRTGPGVNEISIAEIANAGTLLGAFATDYDGDGMTDLVANFGNKLEFFLQSDAGFQYSPGHEILIKPTGAQFVSPMLEDLSQAGAPDLIYVTPSRIRRHTPLHLISAEISAAQIESPPLQPGAQGHATVHLHNTSVDPQQAHVSVIPNGLAVGESGPLTLPLAAGEEADLVVPFKVLETIPNPSDVTLQIEASQQSYFASSLEYGLGHWGVEEASDLTFTPPYDNSVHAIPDPGYTDIRVKIPPYAGIVKKVTATFEFTHEALQDLSCVLITPDAGYDIFYPNSIPGEGTVTKQYNKTLEDIAGGYIFRVQDGAAHDVGTAKLTNVNVVMRRRTGPMTVNVARIRRIEAVPGSELATDRNGDGVIDAGDLVAAPTP